MVQSGANGFLCLSQGGSRWVVVWKRLKLTSQTGFQKRPHLPVATGLVDASSALILRAVASTTSAHLQSDSHMTALSKEIGSAVWKLPAPSVGR